MDDASDNFEDFQDRVRKIMGADSDSSERRRLSDWIAYASPDFDHAVQNAVERVFKLLDLPRRSDIDELNANLERVATAVEALEKSFAHREATATDPDDE